MTREEKAVVIGELKEKFQEKPNFYIMNAGGMTVAEINNFRRFCFEKGIEYKVVKNSLIKKALEDMDGDYTPLFDNALKGFTGLMFSESGSAPAKLLKEYRKKGGSEKIALKGASIEASFFFGEESLENLTKVKSKEDVIAELIGLLRSPGINLVSLLNGPSQNLLGALKASNNKVTGILKALAEKKEKEG